MTGCDVRDLVRHDPGRTQLLRRPQGVESRVDIEETAGQCEGIDVIRVNDLDGERYLRVGVAYQVLADAVHLGDHRVADHLGAGFHLLGIGLAHADFAFNRVPVAKAAAANLAVADGVHVVLAAVMLDLAGVGWFR